MQRLVPHGDSPAPALGDRSPLAQAYLLIPRWQRTKALKLGGKFQLLGCPGTEVDGSMVVGINGLFHLYTHKWEILGL